MLVPARSPFFKPPYFRRFYGVLRIYDHGQNNTFNFHKRYHVNKYNLKCVFS